MEVLTKASTVGKRVKGVRGVRTEQLSTKTINPNDLAYNKLFNVYLKVDAKDERSQSKLGENYTYFSNLLRNNNQLKDMHMIVLAQVLLFLNQTTYEELDNTLDKQIEPYINELINSNYFSTDKSLIKVNTNNDRDTYNIIKYRAIVEFYRYIKFVKLLEENLQSGGSIKDEETGLIHGDV